MELREEKLEKRPRKKGNEIKKRSKKKGRFNKKHGEGDVIVVRLDKRIAPHMMKLLGAKSPAELEHDFDLILPKDLTWPPPTQKKVFSWRVAVILETIARRGRKGAESV